MNSNRTTKPFPKLDSETRAYLNDLVKEDVQELESMLDRNLNHWISRVEPVTG